MFWGKQDNSKIIEEIAALRHKIAEIEIKIDAVEQKFRSLRGLINKKLNYVDDDDDNSPIERNKYNDGFDSLRSIGL